MAVFVRDYHGLSCRADEFTFIMSTAAQILRGSMVALVTPMHESGAIDFVSLAKLIDWHIEQGTDCLVVTGTTGESPTLGPRRARRGHRPHRAGGARTDSRYRRHWLQFHP